ncbi:MAG: methyltransferase [Cytophaga sp.]|nr:methyltransferase [Cytophaga sp.]
MEQVRRPFQGVLNIVRFNWHFYVLSAIVITMLFIISDFITADASILYMIMVLIAVTTATSLLASMYVYDFSDLYQLKWLKEYAKDRMTIVNIHAGFDETSHLIKYHYPYADLKVLDFYDEAVHTEVSIKRARKAYPPYPSTQSVKTSQLPLASESIDLVMVILSAHEIRRDEERYEFFNELKRAIKPDGTIFVTEHQRDIPNFLVYNIGFFHFLSSNSWKRTFAFSGLLIHNKVSTTPFITTYILRKDGAAA